MEKPRYHLIFKANDEPLGTTGPTLTIKLFSQRERLREFIEALEVAEEDQREYVADLQASQDQDQDRGKNVLRQKCKLVQEAQNEIRRMQRLIDTTREYTSFLLTPSKN